MAMDRLIGLIVSSDKIDHRLKNDLAVQPKTPVADVIEVVVNSVLHGLMRKRCTPVPVYLGPSGDSRFNDMPDWVVGYLIE